MIREELRNFLKKITGLEPDILYPPKGFGDYSTNAAFVLSKKENLELKDTARQLAEKLQKKFGNEFEKIEVANNGFINFYLSKKYLRKQLGLILKQKQKFGTPKKIKKQNINVEFVSANPTGPLTLGNARGASYGDTLANILKKAGNRVTKEYYVNDMGKQVNILGESVARRCLEIVGKKVDYPDEMYQGEYIKELANQMKIERFGSREILFEKEEGLDPSYELVQEAKDFASNRILNEIKKTLYSFNVKFDVWFSEKDLYQKKETREVLDFLNKYGLVYKKDNALWFRASSFEPIEDAVIVKSNGDPTYLLSDLAYAKNKNKRKFDKNIYVWGADHLGDVPRVKAGIRALGLDPDRFLFVLLQFVTLRENGEAVRMSKRKGNFILLKELLEEVSPDVARFMFLQKSLDTHIEFDLDLAKEQSSKNPVFYIQYAFARISGIVGKSLKEKGSTGSLKFLEQEEEMSLIRFLSKFPEMILDISKDYQVHHLTNYCLELANAFHRFYEKCKVLTDDENVSRARLALVLATKIVLGECLDLLGIEAPEKMEQGNTNGK